MVAFKVLPPNPQFQPVHGELQGTRDQEHLGAQPSAGWRICAMTFTLVPVQRGLSTYFLQQKWQALENGLSSKWKQQKALTSRLVSGTCGESPDVRRVFLGKKALENFSLLSLFKTLAWGTPHSGSCFTVRLPCFALISTILSEDQRAS